MVYDSLSTFKHRTEMRFVQCGICESWYMPDDIAAMLEDQSACCENCAREADSPGRYESYRGDLDSLGILLLLEHVDSAGAADDFMSNDGWGYCARIGRYLYMVDTQGFRSYDEYQDEGKADAEFTRLYKDGWGATEFDAYIFFDRGYMLQVEGKEVGTYPRLMRARAAMRLEALRTGYYPDLWLDSERGSLQLLKY